MKDTASAAETARLDPAEGLQPSFVRAVLDSIDRGDGEATRALLEPLHAADLADMLGMVGTNERRAIVVALGSDFDPDILSEIDEDLKAELVRTLGPSAVADALRELEAADAAYVLEDLPAEEQQEVLARVSAGDRAEVVDALTFPDYSAGRLMHRAYVTLRPTLTVGEALRAILDLPVDDCPDEFSEVYAVDEAGKPIGVITLSRLLRSPRNVRIDTVMEPDFQTVPAVMDQSDFAYIFEHYHLTCAPVVDALGRLVGVLDAKTVSSVIQEEHQAEVMALAGVPDEGLTAPLSKTTRLRFSWLFVNLLTAILASLVIGLFEASLEKIVALAILMPIVASMGGNAGTQTLTVVVRAMATKDLTASNFMRVFGKELAVAWLNGAAFAVIVGGVTWAWFSDWKLGAVIAAAMIINLLAAAVAGILIPTGLARAGIDPAVSSSVFVTTVTDVVGFLAFLGLATWVLLQ